MTSDDCLACQHFEKTDYEGTLRDIGGERPHSIAAIAADRHKMLNDLLCTVHRDGGHKIKEIGYRKATEEAIAIIAELVQRA
jgi:methylmalonyl-CoA mutase cobalamin-binding subunit